MSIISLKNLSVEQGGRTVLSDISFEIQKGEFVGIIGPNGAGKSTLLKVMAGVIDTYAGKLSLDPDLRIGYVPQNTLSQTTFTLSVQEVLEMAFHRSYFFRSSKEYNQLIQVLEKVGLCEKFLKKSFSHLSGGEKQRVVIARSLLYDPDILLYDESLSAVDFQTLEQMYELFQSLSRDHQTTILFVSHDIYAITRSCSRVLCLENTLHEGCHPIFSVRDKSCMHADILSQIPVHHHHSLTPDSC